MIFETGSYFLDSLIAVVLDARLQIIIGTIGLIHWNWRLPRPMKGAGNKSVFITGMSFKK